MKFDNAEPLKQEDLKLGQTVSILGLIPHKAQYLGYGNYVNIPNFKKFYCVNVFKTNETGEIYGSFVNFVDNVYHLDHYLAYLEQKLAHKTCVLCKRVFEDETFGYCPKCGQKREVK